MGKRIRDYGLRTAALREAAPIFTLTKKLRYQRLCANHLSHVTRMTDGDFHAAGTLFSVSFGRGEHHNVALDEYQEMTNKVVKSAIGRITPGFINKLAPICESRQAAVHAVDDQLYPTPKERARSAEVIRDRAEAVEKVLPFVRKCTAFSQDGAEKLKSFSLRVVNAEDQKKMLAAKKISSERWDEVLTVVAKGGPHGERLKKTTFPVFKAQNTTTKASKKPQRKSALQKDYKDLTLQGKEYHAVLADILSSARLRTAEELAILKHSLGAVLPLAMAHAGDGGGRKANKSKGI
ncbi:unnamed protein product [Sphacelaria rigidula]